MIIAIDYDDTFTRDPESWGAALTILKHAGHTIIGVTMRSVGEAHSLDSRYNRVCETVYCTNRQAKRSFMDNLGIFVGVWIDDSPEFIVSSALREDSELEGEQC